jgi:hypothetical protein
VIPESLTHQLLWHPRLFRLYIKLEDLHKTISRIKRIYSLHQKIQFMAEPTLQQIFGAGAVQDVDSITIAKADLVATGLTASASNTAESLFTAILLKAKAHLTTANQSANIDQSIVVGDGFGANIVIRNENEYRQDNLTITLDKFLGASTIDPDDY